MKMRKNHNRISPYLIVENVEKVSKFIVDVLGGKVHDEMRTPDGILSHSALHLGDSAIMLGRSSDSFPAMVNMIHVYVEDVDATYEKAVGEGCTGIMGPSDQAYGDRSGGITGPGGNIWWLATFQKEVSTDEIAKAYASK